MEQQEGFFLHSQLSIPAASSCFFYIVVPGDTLSYIAVTHHSSVQAIAQANHIPNINLIFPGQRFCIPNSGVANPTAGKGTGSGTGTKTNGSGSGSGTGTKTPVPVTGQTSVSGMVYQVFGPYAQGALHVASCESGLNPGAYNPTSIDGSHAAGVFQILYPSTWMGTPEAGSSPYNAWANVLAAHAIFVRDGYSWREWTCQP
ncbi:MAG: hypothetical protein NVS4B7_13260 [Ktedonobacteraceae bacterium]